jgi:hypothetical protein
VQTILAGRNTPFLSRTISIVNNIALYVI